MKTWLVAYGCLRACNPTGGLILGWPKNNLTHFTVLLQAVVWQKSRVSDHRTALMAVLGAASVANMLPVQHHQEQPEVSEALRKHGHIYRFQREQ